MSDPPTMEGSGHSSSATSHRIKHMQNGISSGCSALSVKCQVSNHKPVGGAGETNE
jgi:hypothetical protein